MAVEGIQEHIDPTGFVKGGGKVKVDEKNTVIEKKKKFKKICIALEETQIEQIKERIKEKTGNFTQTLFIQQAIGKELRRKD